MFFFFLSFLYYGTVVGLDKLKVAQASDHELSRNENKISATVPVNFKLNQGLSPLAHES